MVQKQIANPNFKAQNICWEWSLISEADVQHPSLGANIRDHWASLCIRSLWAYSKSEMICHKETPSYIIKQDSIICSFFVQTHNQHIHCIKCYTLDREQIKWIVCLHESYKIITAHHSNAV